MKILVTPRSFGKTNPELFERLAEKGLTVVKNDTGGILSEDAMIERIAECEGVILGVDPVNAKVLSHAPHLRAIAKYGVGTDNIDLEMCAARGIKVSRTVGANSNAVADYAFTLMLCVARKALIIDRGCRAKNWSKTVGLDIYGRTLGIIGLGAVGTCMVRRAHGFSMNILAYDIHLDRAFCEKEQVTPTDLETLCRESDIISLHAALTEETRAMISAERLNLMKPSAILINTARGELVDEEALLTCLRQGRIYGAGLDVFCQEPPSNPAWYELENVVLGSHTSSSTRGATETMGRMAVDNLLRDLAVS